MDKKATLNNLLDAGVSFDMAVAITKQASVGEIARGSLSPAWMENHIAGKHGKKGPEGFVDNAKSHLKGALRANGRSVVEGAGGAVAGAGVGHLAGKLVGGDPRRAALGAVVGGATGLYGGAIHGAYASLRNQAAEMHKKYKK